MRNIKKYRRQLEQQLTEATAMQLDEMAGALAWREEGGRKLLNEAMIR